MKSNGIGKTRGRSMGPDPVDKHVGKRMKLRRTLLRISQEQLASDIGVTFQQVQKYESGHNRVSASRLFDISKVLNCRVSFFFDDIADSISGLRKTPTPRRSDNRLERAASVTDDPMQRTESLELLRAYWKLGGADLRHTVLALLTNISKE